jgi:hypothetical protein
MMRCSKAAGITAGAWYAWPSAHVGYEIVSGHVDHGGHDCKPLDFDELERWTRVGYERGMRWRRASDDLPSCGEARLLKVPNLATASRHPPDCRMWQWTTPRASETVGAVWLGSLSAWLHTEAWRPVAPTMISSPGSKAAG